MFYMKLLLQPFYGPLGLKKVIAGSQCYYCFSYLAESGKASVPCLILSVSLFSIHHAYIVDVGVGVCSNRVFTEGTCKLLNLVISDLVDEDAVLHSRTQAISALMFGTVALLSKPGQTLAPLIGTWVLSAHTGICCVYTGCANKNNPQKFYLCNCSRFFHGIYSFYRSGFGPYMY